MYKPRPSIKNLGHPFASMNCDKAGVAHPRIKCIDLNNSTTHQHRSDWYVYSRKAGRAARESFCAPCMPKLLNPICSIRRISQLPIFGDTVGKMGDTIPAERSVGLTLLGFGYLPEKFKEFNRVVKGRILRPFKPTAHIFGRFFEKLDYETPAP